MENTEYIVMPALVLDLDGTVRRSKSGAKFIKNADDIEIIPGMYEAVKRYKEKGYCIIAVTNQGGVAYGIKSVLDVREELATTHDLVGELFEQMLYCPYMEGGSEPYYSHRSLFRKPSYGMLALAEWGAINDGIRIDWNKSLMVGDREEDKECAQSAGISFMWAHYFLEKEVMLCEVNKPSVSECPKCGVQVFDPFGGGVQMHDIDKCLGIVKKKEVGNDSPTV